MALTASGGVSHAATTTKRASTARTTTSAPIDYANYADNAQVFSQLQTSVVNAGKTIGVGIHTFNNNGSLPTTVSNLSTMIAEHPSAIIEYNPISAGGSRIGASIKASGIPCVAVNFPIPNCHYFNEDIPYLAKQLAGVFAGEMHKRGWTGSDTEVMLVEVAGAGGVNAVLWDMYAGLATQVSGMNHIKASSLSPSTTTFSNNGLQVNTDVSVDAAYTGFARALQGVPKSKHIVVDCLSDDQCLGAYRALSASGRLNGSMISGFSADPQAIKMLRTSKAWVAESANFFTYWGEFMVPMAIALSHGAKAPALTTPPQAIITKSNVGKYFAANGSVKEFPPLGANDAYLLKTGFIQKFHNVEGLK